MKRGDDITLKSVYKKLAQRGSKKAPNNITHVQHYALRGLDIKETNVSPKEYTLIVPVRFQIHSITDNDVNNVKYEVTMEYSVAVTIHYKKSRED